MGAAVRAGTGAERATALPARMTPAHGSQHGSQHGPQHGRRAAAPPTWPQLAPKLAGDPSLRYNESGRAFMRWMTTHMTNQAQWREFADSLPSHWIDDISAVAERASEEWRDFAEHLRSRQDIQAV
jgi:hypothetical protein